MCSVLEDFKKEGIKEGVLIGTIRTCKKLNISVYDLLNCPNPDLLDCPPID